MEGFEHQTCCANLNKSSHNQKHKQNRTRKIARHNKNYPGSVPKTETYIQH